MPKSLSFNAVVAVSFALLTACSSGGNNRDKTPPEIRLIGDNPMSVSHGAEFVDPGATVSDNVDQGLTATISGMVDTTTLGEYVLTYAATDKAGNSAATVTRVVNVVPLEGQFSGTPIAGLNYATDTLSGTTDASGKYLYLQGETIQFAVGDISMGDAVAAAAQLSLQDLITGSVLYTTVGELKRIYSQSSKYEARLNFNRLNNTLTFLYGLDEDRNPDNGIRIAPGIADLFDGQAIDFAERIKVFSGSGSRRLGPGNKVLRRAAHQAVELGLLSSAALPSHGIALGHYYSVHNVTHNFFSTATDSEDTSGDGTADEVTSYHYDGFGNVIEQRRDNDADGLADYIQKSTYDANQRSILRTYDEDGDGSADRVYSDEYDNNGNRLRYVHDYDGDGVANVIGSYAYDAYGNQFRIESDDDGDGVANFISIYTYDEQGNRLSETTDSDADGQTDSATTYTYDDADRLLTYSVDTDGDGAPNEISRYTYDAAGNRITSSDDFDADGVADRTYTNTYDSNGNKIRDERDTDGNGTIDEIYTWTYDQGGNNLSYSADWDADGTPEEVNTKTYDSDGNRLTNLYDWDADGVADEIWASTYDSDGNRVSYRYDINGDGQWDSVYTYTYNENGNYLTSQRDEDGDGIAERVSTYTLVKTTLRAAIDDVD